MEVALPALVIGSTVASASARRNAASQQNEAIQRSAASTQEAATVSSQQVTDAAQLEKRKIALRAAQIEGTVRAATSGTFDRVALIRQNQATESENLGVVDINLANQIKAIRSGAQANVDRLSAGLVNEGFAGLTGGLQGLSTGLSITSAIGNFGEMLRTPRPVGSEDDVIRASKLTSGIDI